MTTLLILALQFAVAPGFDGTFIQFNSRTAELSPADWTRELDAMRAAGLRIIVLQWLEHGERRFFTDDSATDPVEAILAYADEHAMQVFLGLAMDDRWGKQAFQRDYLESLAGRCGGLAETLWTRYGRHASLAGWYIPPEVAFWGLPDEFAADLRWFHGEIGRRCKAASGGKPVAIAPYWYEKATPEGMANDLRRILPEQGLDIVMLQDGVGAKGWDEPDRVTPFYAAARKVCDAAGIDLWADLECFAPASNTDDANRPRGFVPAPIERIAAQLAAEQPHVSRVVTFDFFHYMSPYRGQPQERLYREYLSLIGTTNHNP